MGEYVQGCPGGEEWQVRRAPSTGSQPCAPPGTGVGGWCKKGAQVCLLGSRPEGWRQVATQATSQPWRAGSKQAESTF